MTPELVMKIANDALITTLLVAGPVLIAAMVAGLIISVFQAVTQIQEMTISFVPKILAVAVVIFFFGPWMLRVMVNFTVRLFLSIPRIIG